MAVVVAGLLFVIPFVFIFLTAAKTSTDALLLEFSWPTSWPVWQNVTDVFSARDYMLVTAFRNSIILTVVSVALLVVMCSMVAFVLQRRPGRVANIVNLLVLSGLIIPPAVVPTIWVLQGMGLFKTLPGLILVEVAFGLSFAVLLFRAFIATIPRELDEAAIIDGCSGFSLFFKVIFPLLRPVTITVILTSSVAIFNDFVNPLYFLPGDQNATVQLTLYNFHEPVQHAVQPALHEHRADHCAAADPLRLLQPQDRLWHDRRSGQGLSELPPHASIPKHPPRVSMHCRSTTAGEVPMPDLRDVAAVLRQQSIELPSWAFGNSGTRFKVFAQQGVPRDPFEKVADAAQVHRYTGVAPKVSLHIPWDKVDDYATLAKHADDLGLAIGAINANVFQDDDYMLGSVTHPDPRVRRKATDHLLECVDVMDAMGSKELKLWFSDGTNYPGQDDARARQDRLAAALAEVYQRLGDAQRFLLEYKLFEPAFYTMDVPDWGTAFAHCVALGPKATVVVDTGHHAPGTNIEFIVAVLLRAGKLGGFDFNSRFYADDDLMVGSADPFQLFRILHEVVKAGALLPPTTGERGVVSDATGLGVSFMLDQCHNIEPKIPGQIRSVMNVQEATAKALLVDADALAAAQAAGDVLGANAVLMDAYNTDVRPLLA